MIDVICETHTPRHHHNVLSHHTLTHSIPPPHTRNTCTIRAIPSPPQLHTATHMHTICTPINHGWSQDGIWLILHSGLITKHSAWNMCVTCRCHLEVRDSCVAQVGCARACVCAAYTALVGVCVHDAYMYQYIAQYLRILYMWRFICVTHVPLLPPHELHIKRRSLKIQAHKASSNLIWCRENEIWNWHGWKHCPGTLPCLIYWKYSPQNRIVSKCNPAKWKTGG